MEFGILGPLVFRDETGSRVIAAPKQRAALALLLLRNGQVVPMESLLDALWNGRPPASALPSLRNYVLRLRRCLGAASGRILSRDGGYLIDVTEGELDLLRFNRLHRNGVSAFHRGEFAEAAAALGSALSQWRGPALADVESDAVQRDECPRLAAAQLDAFELKLEAERALGRRETPLGEIRQFALAHPERESLWEHLILTLLESGRGSEADAAFQHIRHILRTEYGTVPGARLERLRQRMTTAQQTQPQAARQTGPRATAVASAPAPLLVPTPAPAGPAAEGGARRDPLAGRREVIPFHVPGDLADFTGRANETAAAAAFLAATGPQAGRVLVLTGRAGIGKSALAVHIAHAVRESYPDGIAYARLETDHGERLEARDALDRLLEDFGLDARDGRADLERRSAALRSRLADRRVLLVLDGAVRGGQIRPLLPSTPRSAVLITSRPRLDDLAGARHLELAPFSPAESVQLLGKIAGRARIGAESQHVRELLAACGNLPLALRIAGCRLAARPAWSVRNLVERLNDPDQRLDQLKTGELDVRARLESGYRALPPTAAAALRRLGAAERQALSVQEAAALLDAPHARAEQLLECLVDQRFLASTRPGCYAFPDFVKEFVLEQANAPARGQGDVLASRR
jgi:DNA-binding SARP family transcriptional activator/energy-coupling factor transporter ATP-binding protein EcfA2